jgi:hypothetical protein
MGANESKPTTTSSEVRERTEKDWTIEEWTQFMHNQTKLELSLINHSSLSITFCRSLGWKDLGDNGVTNLAEALKHNQSVKILKLDDIFFITLNPFN